MNPDPTSLDRLHDIIAPAPAPWWPPAPGWYWVLAFALIAALVFALRAFARWQHNRYRREALAEFAHHESALADPTRRAAALVSLAELLKRAALTAFPRDQVANLTGPAWFAFLDHNCRASSFSRGAGATLELAAYDPRTAASLDETKSKSLAAQVRTWLAHHDAPRSGGAA